MWSTQHFCMILTKFGFSQYILVKVSDIKAYEDPFSGSWGNTWKQTNGHNKAFHDYIQMHWKLQVGVASSGIMFKPRIVKTFKWFKS